MKTVCAAAVVAASIAGAASANANVVWDLSSQAGNLGSSASYTAGGYTITATGWMGSTASCSSPTYCAPFTATSLYGKTDSGDESGLGIANDPSGEHEIYYPALVQIDVSAPYAAGLVSYQFQMGSSTDGEEWSVLGSNSSISGGLAGTTVLYSNLADENVHTISGYKYYSFLYTGPEANVGGANVLLYKTFSGSVPEPSTWAMLALGFAGLGFAGYRTRRTTVSIVA